MAQSARRGITLHTTSRAPIPVTMVNSETGEEFSFEIRPTSEMSTRDRKLLRDYLQALNDFEATPDADLRPSDYDYVEELMQEAVKIGTRHLDLGRYNSLSFPDRFQIAIALSFAFTSENEAFTDVGNQMRAVVTGQGGENRPNALRRLLEKKKTSQTPPPFSVVPTEDGPPTG